MTRTSSTADPTTTDLPNNGDASLHTNTTSGDVFYAVNVNGVIRRMLLNRSYDIVTSSVTVANTTTETTVYTANIDPNELVVGKVIEVKLQGIYSTANSADTFNVNVYLDGSLVATITSDPKQVTGAEFDIQFLSTIRSVGASGTARTFLYAHVADVDKSVASNALAPIDTTITNTITVSIQWSSATAGDTLTLQQGYKRITY